MIFYSKHQSEFTARLKVPVEPAEGLDTDECRWAFGRQKHVEYRGTLASYETTSLIVGVFRECCVEGVPKEVGM